MAPPPSIWNQITTTTIFTTHSYTTKPHPSSTYHHTVTQTIPLTRMSCLGIRMRSLSTRVNGLGTGISSNLGTCMCSNLGAHVGSGLGTSISSNLGTHVGRGLGSSMGGSLGTCMGSGLGTGIGSGLGTGMGRGLGTSCSRLTDNASLQEGGTLHARWMMIAGPQGGLYSRQGLCVQQVAHGNRTGEV